MIWQVPRRRPGGGGETDLTSTDSYLIRTLLIESTAIPVEASDFWREAGAFTGWEVRVLLTEDLFLGAFGLIRGGELRGIEVRGVNGKRMAVFQIEGPGMEAIEREYHRGPSLVDLRLLKSEVARLKNLAFQALRREESRDAGHERGDRAHQGRERAGRPRR